MSKRQMNEHDAAGSISRLESQVPLTYAWDRVRDVQSDLVRRYPYDGTILSVQRRHFVRPLSTDGQLEAP